MAIELQLLLSLAVIHTVALASPGPDFALVVKMATQERRSTAVASAAGISVAILLHTIFSLTGVSLVIKSSPHLFMAVQLIGACYLGWMGMSAIRAAMSHWQDKQSTIVQQSATAVLTIKQGFMQGLYTNLLNPKALVFFITLFSAMITPEINLLTKLTAAVMLLLLSMVWFSLIALVLSKPSIQLTMKRATPIINLITGLLFLSVALAIISGLM